MGAWPGAGKYPLKTGLFRDGAGKEIYKNPILFKREPEPRACEKGTGSLTLGRLLKKKEINFDIYHIWI